MTYFLTRLDIFMVMLGIAFCSFANTNTTGKDKGETIDISKLPLEVICATVGISKENCSCTNYPFFCSPKKNKHEFKCNDYYDNIEGIVKVVASGLGLIGNSVVLFITYKTWKEILRLKKLIGFLALADFIFAAFELVNAIPLFWTCKWVYNLFWCKFFNGALNISGLLALGLITVIALERYIAIARPFTKHQNKILWISLFITGLVSIASVIPMIVVLDIDEDNLCVENWGKNSNGSLIYSWYLLIATFAIPMIIISYFYCGVVKAILLSGKSFEEKNDKDNNYENRNKANRRAMLVVFAITLSFFLLAFPNRVVWVILDTIGTSKFSSHTYRILKYLCIFPYLFHVSINPIIYSFIDKHFQGHVKNLIKKKDSTSFRKISRPISDVELSI